MCIKGVQKGNLQSIEEAQMRERMQGKTSTASLDSLPYHQVDTGLGIHKKVWFSEARHEHYWESDKTGSSSWNSTFMDILAEFWICGRFMYHWVLWFIISKLRSTGANNRLVILNILLLEPGRFIIGCPPVGVRGKKESSLLNHLMFEWLVEFILSAQEAFASCLEEPWSLKQTNLVSVGFRSHKGRGFA